MTKRQLFYFIQPEILLETRRYKIGISQSFKYDRIKNYGSKARLLLTFEDLINAKDFEKIIIKKFNKKFKSVGGNEYFEGCEYLMSNVIYQEYVQYKYQKEVQIIDYNYEDKEIFYVSSDEENDDDYLISNIVEKKIINIDFIGKKTKYNNLKYLRYNQGNFAINFKQISNNKLRRKRYKKRNKYYTKLLNK